jgi:hypothetical protein
MNELLPVQNVQSSLETLLQLTHGTTLEGTATTSTTAQAQSLAQSVDINMSVSTFVYNIIDASGTRWESRIPTQEAAETALTMLQAANPETPLMIEPEQIYPVQGLGRDPDLH